jgi:hypothetical protein
VRRLSRFSCSRPDFFTVFMTNDLPLESLNLTEANEVNNRFTRVRSTHNASASPGP